MIVKALHILDKIDHAAMSEQRGSVSFDQGWGTLALLDYPTTNSEVKIDLILTPLSKALSQSVTNMDVTLLYEDKRNYVTRHICYFIKDSVAG